MKKFIFFLFLLLPIVVFGQEFKAPINVSFFTGTSIAQKNSNNQSYWYGLYLDYMFGKNGTYFGLASVASQSHYQSNTANSLYTGKNSSLGGGLAFGKYINYIGRKTDAYFGTNALLRYDQDIGEGSSVTNGILGKYSMTRSDLLLSGELNINFLKRAKSKEDKSNYHPNLFPRTQIRLTFQEPLSSQQNSFWNEDPIVESLLWSKTAYAAELRQSICQFGGKTMLEPKAIVAYNYYQGDKSHWFLSGVEIGLKKQGRDNFLSVYFLMKRQIGNFQSHLNDSQFVIGLNITPSNIK